MVIIGVLLDMIVFKTTSGYCGIFLHKSVLSFIMSTPVLKTDKKAKGRAYEMLTVYGKGKEQNRSVACAERS